MLTLQSLIHVPINLLHCLKAVWCQVWWFFGFSQQMGLTVSPLLYLMWPLYGATSVGARAREAVSPTLWHHVSPERPEARALIHIYFLLRPALEAPENNLSVVEVPLPPPAEWTSMNSHLFNSFNLIPLLSWLVGHPFSDLRHKPSSQPELLLTSCWLHLSVTKRCLFFLQSVFGMGPLLSSAGASWWERLTSHWSFGGSLLSGSHASGLSHLKPFLYATVRIIQPAWKQLELAAYPLSILHEALCCLPLPMSQHSTQQKQWSLLSRFLHTPRVLCLCTLLHLVP